MVDSTPAPKKVDSKKASIYCRIRPQAHDGSGHDQSGAAVAKSLKEWDDTTVTLDTQYMFSKGEACYKFPKKIFRPEAT